jgi:hypothetical protein
LGEYDTLLEQAKERADAFRSTAKEFIPKMYKALRDEDPNASPEDIRDRIEKDCVEIWSKRTILEALPDEAKDPKKQKAATLRQKKQNSAAVSAAPSTEKKEKIRIDTEGKPIENDEPIASSEPSSIDDTASSDNSFNQRQNNINLLKFSFSLSLQTIWDYLAPFIFKNESGEYPIWFTGVLDRRTDQVISPAIGETSSSQQSATEQEKI